MKIEEDLEELFIRLLAALSDQAAAAIEMAGYDPVAVIQDFLIYDQPMPRESLLALAPAQRPKLP